MLAVTQLSSNGSRAWLNRDELDRRLIGWFAIGRSPAPSSAAASC